MNTCLCGGKCHMHALCAYVIWSPVSQPVFQPRLVSFFWIWSTWTEKKKNKYVCSGGSCRGSRAGPVLFSVTVCHLDDWSESWRHWLLPSVNTSVSCKPRSGWCHVNATWQPWIKACIAFDCIRASTTMSNVNGQQLLDCRNLKE